ncbi:MAG: hypothetical protein DHS20C13_27980 [Thermodesulfobacteriota bacterium]|nr:MAG: hypothetical protein DHS20C13_27980 [Thermodesulfobacteriota bacterium]
MPKPDADPVLTKRQVHNARDKIAKDLGKTITFLNETRDGEVKATTAQITAAKTLLSKVMPDQTSIEHLRDEEPKKTRKEIVQDMSKAMLDRGFMQDVVNWHPSESREGFKLLGELLNDKKLSAVG